MSVLPDIEPTPQELLDAVIGDDVEAALTDWEAMEQSVELATRLESVPAARGTANLSALEDTLARERDPRRGWDVMLCATSTDPNLWWPESRGGTRRRQEAAAREVCRRCPSRVPCLLDALAFEEPTRISEGGGIWGGATGADRNTLLDAMAAGAAETMWSALADGRDAHDLAGQLQVEWDRAAGVA